MAAVSTQGLEAALAQAVQQEADNLREQEIQSAVERFEKRLREVVLMKAVDVTGYYSMERRGDDLVLTVRHK